MRGSTTTTVRLRWTHAAIGLIVALNATAANDVRVTVQTADTPALEGTVHAFELGGGLTLTTGHPAERTHVHTEDLVSIEIPGRPATVPEAGVTVVLANGDRFTGAIAPFADDEVALDSPRVGRVRLPLNRIAAVLRPADRSRRVEARLCPDRSEDVLLLHNADLVRGLVTAIGPDGVRIETALGDTVVPWDRCAAARLMADPTVAPEQLTARVQFADGDIVTVASLHWPADANADAIAVTCAGQSLHFPVDAVARVDIVGGRWQWLSSLEPSELSQVSMLGQVWPPRRDRNVLGDPMRIAGQRFDRGVGVHSRCVLRYDLAGRYAYFVTHGGLDDASGPFGNVDVEIRVDGTVRHAMEHVVRGRVQGPVRIDIHGARQLELVVDSGANGSIQDYFDWAEAALVR